MSIKLEAVPVSIRELKTSEDFMYQGELVSIKLKSCQHDGIHVRFVTKIKGAEDAPKMLLGMLGLSDDGNGNIEKTIVSGHVHKQWYDQFIGNTLEKKVRKEIKRIKKVFESVQEAEKLAEEIQIKL